MKKTLIVICLFMASHNSLSCMQLNTNQPLAVEGIYILGMTGKDVFKQCSRASKVVEQVWKPTVEQVRIIEKRLKRHLQELDGKFRYLPESAFHRQYIGFTQSDIEHIYINVYPTDENRQINESIYAIVNCEKTRNYWGISFNLKDFSFGEIESNDKLDNIKLILPPKNLK